MWNKWWRGPHQIRIVFLAVMILLATTLGCVAWWLLEQDQQLSAQRLGERQDNAADLAVVALENRLSTIEQDLGRILEDAGARPTSPGNGAVFVQFQGNSIRTWPENGLVYNPAVRELPEASDALFATADELEFQKRNYAGDLEGMFNAYDRIQPSRTLFDETLQSMKENLKQHRFSLSAKDLDRIKYVFNAFYQGGPQMDYKFASTTPSQRVPSFVSLMLTDDHRGTNWNFLGTKAAYDRVRDMQKRNVIVPLVGDFAGSRTLQAIAGYLKQHNATVSVFCISNVEYYIQPEPGKWKSYLKNLAALPVAPNSTIIRWVSSTAVTSLEPLKPR